MKLFSFFRSNRDPRSSRFSIPAHRFSLHRYRPTPEALISNHWRMGPVIYTGSSATILEAHSVSTGFVGAVKVVTGHNVHQLQHEYFVYNTLKATKGIPGVPRVFTFEMTEDTAYLVMDRLGHNLERVMQNTDQLSLGTVYILGIQLLLRIQVIHSHGIIHRDIKPGNILLSTNPSSTMAYLIDFRSSKLFRDPETERHIPWREGKNPVGTCRFCSTRTHKGHEQARRDDLESIAYCMVYLFKGTLPWQGGVWRSEKVKNERVGWMKEDIEIATLCHGMGSGMIRFLEYVKQLSFEETPDYEYLRHLLRFEINRLRFRRRELVDGHELVG